jgi:hypothetical protein
MDHMHGVLLDNEEKTVHVVATPIAKSDTPGKAGGLMSGTASKAVDLAT